MHWRQILDDIDEGDSLKVLTDDGDAWGHYGGLVREGKQWHVVIHSSRDGGATCHISTHSIRRLVILRRVNQ